MRVVKCGGLLAAAVLAGGCSTPAAKPSAPAIDPAAMKAAVAQAMEKLDSAYVHRDTTGVANFYADDATQISAGGGVNRSRAAIMASTRGMMATYDSATAGPAVIDAFFPVDSANAVVFAHVDYTVFMKGKKSPAHVNYSATHFMKGSDGAWHAHHDYSVDIVAKAAAPAK